MSGRVASAWRRLRALPALARMTIVAIAVLLVVVALTAPGGGTAGGDGAYPSALADLVPYDGRSPSETGGARLRVLVELSRPPLSGVPDAAGRSPRRQRAYVRSLADEGRSLRSALQARGVALRDVRSYARTWNGFAATVDAEDVAALSGLGIRAQPVRRFYPAVGEPVPVPDEGVEPVPLAPGGPPVAVLASGVQAGAGPLKGRTQRGFDVVDGDRDAAPGTDPRDVRRRETSGTALAAVVAAGGERVLPIRVAGVVALPDGAEELATTDTVLAGLERAVDPDGDGSTGDAVRVALVGVHAPYAGFSASPEAKAIRGAERLGTVVVAPAGHEGRGRGGTGTVGSPGAAPAALTAGAYADRRAPAHVALTVGEVRVEAAMLGGPPVRTAGLRAASPVGEMDVERLVGDEGSALRGRVAIVAAGNNPSAMAAAASTAGAELVILAEAREDRALPAVPAGRVGAPVLGATGEAASALLELRGGEAVRVGVLTPGVPAGDGSEPAPGSSRGPSLSGSRKPDVLAAGAALTALPDGGAALAGGTGVAAARIAVRAARLARSRPAETARSIRAALADPEQTPDSAAAPPQVPLGPLELQDAGVRFTLGAFERGDPFGDGTELHAAAMLELELLGRGGAVVRTLTPPGGARDLLPAEYAYSLPRELRDTLGGGPLRFRARARPPRGGPATTRTSPPLRAP